MTEMPDRSQPAADGPSVEGVAAELRRCVELIPTEEVGASLEHLRAASGILHNTLDENAASATEAVDTAERHGQEAQMLLHVAADSLTAYLTGSPGESETGGSMPAGAAESIGAGPHPRTAAALEEAQAAQDRLVPMLGKGKIGRYLEELNPLSDGALCELLRRGVPFADEAILRRHEGLLWQMARREHGRRQLRAVDVGDLWAAGAAEFLWSSYRYDPARETELISYAGNNARNAMKSEIQHTGHNIRLPSDIQSEVIVRILQENNQRLAEGRRPLSDAEISERFKLPITLASRKAGQRQITVAEIRRAMFLTTYLGSLDTGYSPHDLGPDNPYILDERHRLLTVEGEPLPEVDDEVAERELRRIIYELLDTISEKEKKWILLRFGFERDAVDIRTAAREMEISMSQAQALEVRALGRLKHVSRRRRLTEHLITGEADAESRMHPYGTPGDIPPRQ